jgi:predicted small secreted protein
MKRTIFSLAVFLLFSLLLTACNKPKTPQEVSSAFWYAVIQGKEQDAVRYSTLASTEEFDSFGHNWHGMIPAWGRVIIDEKEARIHTHISKPDASESEMLYFVTYLVKQEDGWKVDYEKTGRLVRASAAVSDFVNRITTMGNEITRRMEETGNEISRQLEDTSNAVSGELEAMSETLLQLAEIFGTEASITIQEYGLKLQQDINSLAKSIEQAIREQQGTISPEDKEKMENSVEDLHQTSKNLDQPDMKHIAETGEVVVITRKKLNTLDSATFKEYQVQWQQWVDRFLEDMNMMLDDLAKRSGE